VFKVQQLFGENLKFYRKRANLTQDELSSTVNVSLLTIQNWESGRRWPAPDSIELLCEALSVTPVDLFASHEKKAAPAGTTLSDAWQILKAFERAKFETRQAVLALLDLVQVLEPDLDSPKEVSKPKSNKR
jgi:transcriptional regulator with XRE-family HTH domain